MECVNCNSDHGHGRLCEWCDTARKVETEVRSAAAAVSNAIDRVTMFSRRGLRHDFDYAAVEKVLTAANDALAAYQPTIR